MLATLIADGLDAEEQAKKPKPPAGGAPTGSSLPKGVQQFIAARTGGA